METKTNGTEKYFEHIYKSIDLPDGITAMVDYVNYKKVIAIKDFEQTINGKTIGLSHVYSSDTCGGAPYGYGFKLNFCEIYNDEVGVLVEANGDEYNRTDSVVKNYITQGRLTPVLIENVPEANNLNRYNNLTWLYADGVYKGYAVSDSKLKIICDTAGDCIILNYNADGSLQNVRYSKGGTSKPVFELSYTNGYLSKVIDKITNESIIYTYGGIRLETIQKSGITYGIALSEDDEDSTEIGEITTGNGYKIINTQPVITVKSVINKIPDGTAQDNTIAQWNFSSTSDKTVVITDIDGNRERIKYADAGYISEQITERNGVVVSARRSEYVKQSHCNTYEAIRESLYKQKIEDYEFECGEYTQTQLNEYDRPTASVTQDIRISETAIGKAESTYSYDGNNRLTREQTVITRTRGGAVFNTETRITEYEYSDDGKTVTKTSWVSGEESTNGKIIEKQITNGNVVETVTYNSKEPANRVGFRRTYNTEGQLISESNGIDDEVVYAYNNGKAQSAKYPGMNTISYSYDTQNRITKISNGNTWGSIKEKFNAISYTSGEITNLTDGTNGSTAIALEYEGKRRLSKATVGGQTVESSGYVESTENGKEIEEVTLTYGNGATVKSVAAKDGSYIKGYIGNTQQYALSYNKDGSIYSETDKITGETLTYTYGGLGQVIRIDSSNGTSVTYTCDRFNKLTDIIDAEHRHFIYGTDSRRQLTCEYTDGKYENGYTYDLLGRLSGKSVKALTTNKEVIKESIAYEKVGSVTGNRPAKITFTDGVNSSSYKEFSYSYDNGGRISRIDTNKADTWIYTYDSFGRLKSEENYWTSERKEYAYDDRGNLKSIDIYDIYTDEDGNEICYGTTEYGYDDKNRLKGTGYSYDAIGNPTKYRNNTLTWLGRRLTSYGNTTFGYDGFGRRKSKGSITFAYDLSGNLKSQSNGLEFFYDSQGVAGFKYNGNCYYYKKDALGNIVEILNANGVVEAYYNYDAWGNHSTSGNSTIANLNPFRYRGYYYDTETGLYYLQTRYYDPRVGRFLNMDEVDYADPTAVHGLNLYAYCNNDPVNNVDPTGTTAWWEWLLLGVAAVAMIGAAVVATVATGGVALVAGGIAIGGAIGGLTSIVGQGLTNGWDNISVGGIAGGMLIGSVLGGIGAAAIGSAGVGAGALALANGGSVYSSAAAVAGVGLIATNVRFSKHNPGMSNKPPVSWTDIDEGINVYNKFGGNSNKATEYLLNQFRGPGNWHKGAGTEFNALKKWFDRIIRLLIK